MWKYIENQKQLNLKVELDDLESGEYQQKIYRINSDNGNVLGIWGEMGYIRDMDREDVKYFRRVCEPKMLIDNMNVVRHQMEINLTLEPNEITFVRIRKIG
jgi:beta-xylosidase